MGSRPRSGARVPPLAAAAALLALLAAPGCASPSADRPVPGSPGTDIGATISLYGWAPRFHGEVTLDGAKGDPDGAPWGAGFGISGEIRPPGWFTMFDFGGALFANDLGLEEVHPDFLGSDVDHTLRILEVAGGPCLFDLPAGDARGDGLLGPGRRPGRRPTGPSRLRVDPFVGVRGYQLTVGSDLGPDVEGDAIDRIWVDAVAGLRVEALPLPRLALRARGDAGGLGVASHRAWRASASASLLLGEGFWLTAGWNFLSVDYERGDSGRFRFNSRLDGPFLSLDFWF